VYAIAAGAGYSSDAYHIAHPAPDGAGVVAAISRALADARVDPGQVVHVNAHATSTPEGDAVEAQALVADVESWQASRELAAPAVGEAMRVLVQVPGVTLEPPAPPTTLSVEGNGRGRGHGNGNDNGNQGGGGD